MEQERVSLQLVALGDAWVYVLGITVALFILSTCFFVLLWNTKRERAKRRGYDEDSCEHKGDQHFPDIGCPVVMTSQSNFHGDHVCFQLGKHRNVDLQKNTDRFSNGVMSFGIQRGYTLVAYSEPGFKGKALIVEKGPHKTSMQRDENSIPAPRSLKVRFKSAPTHVPL